MMLSHGNAGAISLSIALLATIAASPARAQSPE